MRNRIKDKKVDYIRRKYPLFSYDQYGYKLKEDGLILRYRFSIGKEINFNPSILIRGITNEIFGNKEKIIIDNMVYHIGLAEIPTYWKSTCSPQININAGGLTDDQKKWWLDLMIKGMGEYFFENDIDFTRENFVRISTKEIGSVINIANIKSNSSLIPVSGGKDSTTTLELLLTNKCDISYFLLKHLNVIDNKEPAEQVIRASGIKDGISVEREIDKRLLSLNKEGFLNGHVPYSSYLAFMSIFVSYLLDKKYIVFSNEKSSEESNIEYLGNKINHQYSKTFEFENKFRDYNNKYLSDINYFSFLRPLYDIQITKLFSKYKKYHQIFRSCNVSQKGEDFVWCCQCPKCLSTFILLYPFLGPENVTHIFSKNLYEVSSLKPLLDKLVKDEEIKPFECVGTRLELKIALYMSIKLHSENSLPYLLDYVKKNVNLKEVSKHQESLLSSWDNKNNLPEEFKDIVKKSLNAQ